MPFASASFDIKHIEEDRMGLDVFMAVDVLLLPTTTDVTPTLTKAKKGGPQALSGENTMFCNYFGLPSVSIPCGFDGNGLPIGLQVAGAMREEGNVLQVAYAYQQATEWHLRRPL